MCLASVYIGDEAGSPGGKPVLSDVACIERRDDGLLVTDLLGRSELVQAEVRFIDFLEGTVVLRPTDGADGA